MGFISMAATTSTGENLQNDKEDESVSRPAATTISHEHK